MNEYALKKHDDLLVILRSVVCWLLNESKEGRKLVCKGFFGVGKWKKDRISKLKTFLTKAISQYTFKMHLKAIQKSNNKVIYCSILHNIAWFLLISIAFKCILNVYWLKKVFNFEIRSFYARAEHRRHLYLCFVFCILCTL